MKITKRLLRDLGEGVDEVAAFEALGKTDAVDVLTELIKVKNFGWANWLLFNILKRPQYVKYVIYAGQQDLGEYEKIHPENNGPRKALEATKNWLKDFIADGTAETDRDNANIAYVACFAAYTKRKIKAKRIQYGIKLLKESEL